MIEEARAPAAAGRTLTCHPAEGGAGIAETLARAMAGDTVVLSPGVYESMITLEVPSGVTMCGDGQAILQHGADGPAVTVIGGHDVTLSGFTVVCVADSIRRRVLPDDRPLPEPTPEDDDHVAEWGLVWARDAVAVRFDRLRIEGRPEHEYLRGLVLRGTRDCRVVDCVVEKFGGTGLSLISSTDAVVESCDLSFSSNGLALFRSRATLDAPSNAVIRSNRCHDNAGSGILLASSDSEDLVENECWANGDHGIVLRREPHSPEAPSNAVIRSNRCHDNAGSGIILASSDSADLTENECWANGWSGIILQRHSSISDAPSNAVIRSNRCHDNGGDGIFLSSSESADLAGNECWANGTNGIALQRDPDSPEGPSTAVVRSNRCHDNGDGGILLASSDSEDLAENECWANGDHGIILRREPHSPEAPSNAVIRSNRCHDNAGSGIILSSSESADLAGNECWANGTNGIALRREPHSPEAPSNAVIRSNRCHDNAGTGILLASSDSEDLAENECWANGWSGIILQRHSSISDAPSNAVIRSNRCHDNGDGGIFLSSSESADLAGNECWANGTNGIALQRDPDSPEAPSTTVVRSNRCHDNASTGIYLMSSVRSDLTDNECWDNGTNGITLQRHSSISDAPSTAVIRSNRCHDNAGTGILLASSDSADLSDNECWDNGFSGITLLPDSDIPEAPSSAVIRSNRCHGNRDGGIFLSSSESTDLSDNECWDNGTNGIALQPHPETPEAPSSAVIRSNRCHGNQTGFAITAGSVVTQAGNRAWSNQHDRSLITSNGFILGQLDWFIAGAGETRAESLQRLRSRAVGGAVAARLAAEGQPAPDATARAVVCGPSSTALAALLADDAVDDDEHGVVGGAVPDGPETGGFRLAHSGDRLTRFHPTGRADLVAAVWSRVYHHVVDRRFGATVIGVAGDSEKSVDRLIRSIAAMRDAGPESLPDGDLRPSGAASLIMQMRAQGERLSAVVRADVHDRSEAALAGVTPPRALLEPARPEGIRLWTAGAAALATSRVFWGEVLAMVIGFLGVAAAVGHFKGAEAPWWDLWTAALHAVTTNVKDAQLKDVWEVPALAIAALFGVFVLLNRHLPGHLAVEPPALLARFADKFHVDSSHSKAAPRGAPWRRFVRRWVFADGSIGVVVLADAAEWSDEDCRALQDLLTLRRDDETLIVVVTMATRTVLDRALLLPFADGIDLSLVLEPEHGMLTSLAVSEAKTREALGLETELDDRVLDAIRDRRWTIGDLQPMLTLGSTSRAPFCVRRSALIDLQHFGPPLRDALEPFARLFLADPAFRLEIERDAVALEAGLTMARRAYSTRVYSRTGPMGEEYEISGRFEMRDTMAGIVARIYADLPEAGDDYVLRMMQCGMWFALDTAARVVDRDDVLTTRLLDARRHLESAARLAEDAETFSATRAHLRTEAGDLVTLRRTRGEMLAAHRRVCLERLVSWRVPTPSPRERALASQLFALLVHVGAVDDVPEPIEQGDCPTDPTLGQCFAFNVGTALAAFARVDRDLARQLALRALRAEGHFLRARDDGRLMGRIDERRKSGRPLADFLAQATSLSEFTACLDAHAGCGSDVVVTALALAIEEIETEDQSVRLARLIERLRGRGVRRHPAPRIRGFCARPRHSAEDLLDWLEKPELIERLLKHAKRPPTEPIDLLEIMYGSTDRIFGIEKPTSIVLGEE